MELCKFEWRKLRKNKLMCGLLLGCFLLNALFLYHQSKSYDKESMCFPESIKKVYEELEEIPQIGRDDWLEHEMEKAEELTAVSVQENEEAFYERRNALRYVHEHVQGTCQYEKYLDGIERQAAWITGSSLFAQRDLFSRRNAERIPQKYKHLHRISLKAENPQGILLATESRITDLLVVAVVILLAVFFISMEREEGTMAFARCIRYGGKRLGMVKIAIVVAGSLVCTALLYGSNFLIAGILYGFGDLRRGIQSVAGYLASPWRISLGSYFFLFMLGKLAATTVIAAIVVWIALRGKSILSTGIMLLTAAVAEYSLYMAILPHSWMDVARQCNLFWIMRTEHFFQGYETMNVFQYPVSSVLVCGVFGCVLAAAAIWFSVVSYERVSKKEYAGKRRKTRFCIRKRKKGHSLLYYESYKLLWVSKAGILMVIFLILQFMTYSGEKRFFTLDELYYKNYIQKLEGEVTREKLDFIKKEGKRIEKLEEELHGFAEKEEGMHGDELQQKRRSLEQQLSCQTAYQQIKMQADRIGKSGIFLNEIGYAYLLDKEQQLYQVGKLLIIWLLAFHSAFIVDEMAGMPSVWNTIPNGQKKLRIRKWMVLTGCIVLLCVMSDGIFIVCRMKVQRLSSIDVPIQYLPGFAGWKHISVRGYLAGLCAAKILLGILTCGLFAVLSKKVQNASAVLVVSGSAAGLLYLLLNLLCNT